MYKIALMKGKKIIATYSTAYEADADTETINITFGERASWIHNMLRKNAFVFAMPIAKPKLCCNGYKYILKEV